MAKINTMMPKVLVAHPTANTFVRALVDVFLERDMLTEFHTSVAVFPDSVFEKLARLNSFTDLRRRYFDSSLRPYLHQWPLVEVGRQLSARLGLNRAIRHEAGLFSVDAVYRNLDRTTARRVRYGADTLTAVYAYEDSALATFTEAKKKGIACVYELPIAYWLTSQRLMHEEADRLPAWEVTLGGGTQDSAVKLDRKSRELALADLVVVPSTFVKDSLPASVGSKRVLVSPFGSPTATVATDAPRTYSPSNRPLRVLFAGSMGQRKGLGDLFEAVKLLNSPDIELVAMGSLLAPMAFYRQQLSTFTYEHGRPHADVLALMRSCDVFCLPSIVEGRALVMQEAMSQGLPLIITPNTGGSDLVIEGKTGFSVPIRSPAAIAQTLQWLLDNRACIPEMGRMAQAHAATYTWHTYATTIAEAVGQLR